MAAVEVDDISALDWEVVPPCEVTMGKPPAQYPCACPSVARVYVRCGEHTAVAYICQKCLDKMQAGRGVCNGCGATLTDWRQI